MKIFLSTVVAVGLASVAVRSAAQDIDFLAKWTAAEVVHYDVVLEFADEVPIVKAQNAVNYKALVTDRIELGFDWNQAEMKIVGMPTIKNFPSTTTPRPGPQGCPAARIRGTYEHLTATALKGMDYSPAVELTGNRSFPAGALASMNENGCAQWNESPASTVSASEGLLVVPSMYLGMPAAGTGMEIDAARSTIKSAPQRGWTYTYKLSIK